MAKGRDGEGTGGNNKPFTPFNRGAVFMCYDVLVSLFVNERTAYVTCKCMGDEVLLLHFQVTLHLTWVWLWINL